MGKELNSLPRLYMKKLKLECILYDKGRPFLLGYTILEKRMTCFGREISLRRDSSTNPLPNHVQFVAGDVVKQKLLSANDIP